MKFLIVLAAIVAVSTAQFSSFGSFGNQDRYKPVFKTPPTAPPRYNTPAPVAPSRGYSGDQDATIVRYDNDASPDGSYSYSYETSNGIAAQEQGTPRDFGGSPPVVPVVVQGSFAYTAPDGVPVSISYVADENGYQPQGDVLPTPPAIPPAIQRALEYLARNGQKK